jgi:hypothetical protein
MMKLVCKATGVVVSATDEQAAILISGGFEPADGRKPVGKAEPAAKKEADEPSPEESESAGREDVADVEGGDEPDLDTMNVMKLKSYAKSEFGLTFPASAKRPEIVKAIEEAKAARGA